MRPDTMDVSATVTAVGEITTDALKKFRANRRRAVDAITKLKIPGLEIKGSGVSVISNATVQQFQQRFGNMQQGSDQTTFRETLTFAVSGIDHLSNDQVQDLVSKILDAAKDAGLTLGRQTDQNPYVYNADSYKPQIVFFRFESRRRPSKSTRRGGQGRTQESRTDGPRLKLASEKPCRCATLQPAGDQSAGGCRGEKRLHFDRIVRLVHNMSVEAFVSVEFRLRIKRPESRRS